MKYNIGSILTDKDGNQGVVYIKWNDGDLCRMENDSAHPGPRILSELISLAKRLGDYCRMLIEIGELKGDSPVGIAYRDFIAEWNKCYPKDPEIRWRDPLG